MNDQMLFLSSIFAGRARQINEKVFHGERNSNSYFGKRILEKEKGLYELTSAIEKGDPYVCGRFGSSECLSWVQFYRKYYFKSSSYGKHIDVLCNNAGFFPYDETAVDQYCKYVLQLFSRIDLLCCMNTVGESFIIKKHCDKAKLTRLEVVDPCITKWTSVLEGKRVLVIHPMAELIEKQYNEKRDLIYLNDYILPEFHLRTVKAVQTITGEVDSRFSNWFEALDYMVNEALKKDFDIALIGCGAYGLPLACRLKDHGKIAIHMGGCLQLLFGIRGGRWDNIEYMQKYYNDAWVRPVVLDTPEGYKKIENGCYW